VPAFGVKIDAVPGRINETWLRIEEPGTYYGQCSELCGDYHGFMPIMVEAVSKDEFEAWTQKAKEEFARADAIDVARR
jgi:cytochrome c oxidase subunit II